MPRVPYVPDDVAAPRDLVETIRARRGGRLFNLDRMLLHSPPFASGWNTFLGNVRRELSLPPRLRELAICAVAIHNRADYEFRHHLPELVAAGATPAQVAALEGLAAPAPDLSPFDTAERAVLALTRELTADARVSDATFAAAAAAFEDTRQLVELIGVVAAYNMVSRFLVALDVEPE